MANHKSATKAHTRSLTKCAANNVIKSKIKTFSTRVESAVKSKEHVLAVSEFRLAESQIMKAVTKGVLKLNTAARKVSNLAKRVKSLEA
jgi:small subunit ribosomal protein S20